LTSYTTSPKRTETLKIPKQRYLAADATQRIEDYQGLNPALDDY